MIRRREHSSPTFAPSWVAVVATAVLAVVSCTATESGGAGSGGAGASPPATGGSNATATGGAGTGGAGTGGAGLVPGTGGAGTGGAVGTGGAASGGATGTGGASDADAGVATGGSGTGGGPSDASVDSGTGGNGGVIGSGGRGGNGGAGGRAGSGGAGGAGSRKAVMVVRGAGTATAGDMVMLARLTAHGFQTTILSDAAVTAASVAAVDLVVISSSAESGPLGTKLRDVVIPMLCVENGQYRNQGMTGASRDTHWGEIADQTAVTILPGATALVGALTGNVTVSRTAGPLGWGLPAATALKGATVVGNANQSAIFGYAKGDQMVGMVAPARRAGFAIREAMAASLTADGIALFDAVLTWVLQ